MVTTRDTRSRLDSLLASAGADVVHVPLIQIELDVDAVAHGLDLDGADWLVVTSRHGAAAAGAVAARAPHVRLAAVGTRTAERLAALAGRPVDLVPETQTASELVAALPGGPARTVVAQADRADATLVDGLRARGHAVSAVTAYRTILRTPTAEERLAAVGASAVTFASGSAAEGWMTAFGRRTPPVVVAIGPTTAGVASGLGLQVTHVAADHSMEGLTEAVISALSAGP